MFAPFGTADFGAKISELGANPAEGLYVTIFGSDAINLAKQQAQFGLFGKYKMVIGNSFVIPQVLPAMGDAALGVYQTLGFVPGEPGAQAEAFVKAYKEKYNGELPAYTVRRPICRDPAHGGRDQQGEFDRRRRGARGALRPQDRHGARRPSKSAPPTIRRRGRS